MSRRWCWPPNGWRTCGGRTTGGWWWPATGTACHGCASSPTERGLTEMVRSPGGWRPTRWARCCARRRSRVQPDPPTRMAQLSTMAKTVEYVARGVPVVAVDMLETRRTARGAAHYVPTGDPDELAKAIDQLLADSETRTDMRRGGRARFESNSPGTTRSRPTSRSGAGCCPDAPSASRRTSPGTGAGRNRPAHHHLTNLQPARSGLKGPMDLLDLLKLMVRRWYVTVPVLLGALAAALVVGGAMPPEYKTTSAVLRAATVALVPGGDRDRAPGNPWLRVGEAPWPQAVQISALLARVPAEGGRAGRRPVVRDEGAQPQRDPDRRRDQRQRGRSPSATVTAVNQLIRDEVEASQAGYPGRPASRSPPRCSTPA